MASISRQTWSGLLILVALLPLATVVGQDVNLGFCNQLLRITRFSCPAFQRVKALDYRQLKGVWYEIASTANLRQRTEAGVSCSTSRFAVTNKPRILSVTNRGVVSVGVTRLAATSSLFNHASRISRHLSSLCSALTSLNASSSATVAAQLRLARTALPQVTLPPAKQTAASASLATVAAQIGSISQLAGSMYGQLAQLQQQAGYASQLDSPSNLTAVSNVLQRGWGRVFAFAANIQKARGKLNKAVGTVALSLVNQTVPANQKTAKMKLLNAFRRLQFQSGLASRLYWSSALSAANAASASPIGATLFPAILPLSYPTATTASFQQGKVQPGGFSVSLGRLASYYSLVSLQPNAAAADAVAVFTTCPGRRGNLLGWSGQTDAVILSRSPAPSQAAIDNAIAAIQANGIVTNGRNPLVFTNQDSATCSKWWQQA